MGTYKLIRKLQRGIVIWNDGGDRGDLRWVGTEAGFAGETNWSLLNATSPAPNNMLRNGLENGDSWVPGEVNTSIRRNGTLLLNFPAMPNGLIHKNDEKAALDLAKAVKEAFAMDLARNAKAEATNVRCRADKFGAAKAIDGDKDTYWATDDNVTTASLTLDFGKATMFNRFLAQECIHPGQRVKAFTVEALVDGHWEELAQATTIGYKRILRFPSEEATQVRFTITDSKSCPAISNVGIYNAPQILTPPSVIRNQAGDVIITPADKESVVYCTTDGNVPTEDSNQYTGPLHAEGKVQVSAVAYEPPSGKSSPVCHEAFDLPRNDWRLVGIDDPNAYTLLDGNPSTAWHQPRNRQLPVALVIDLGKEQNLGGFRCFPD